MSNTKNEPGQTMPYSPPALTVYGSVTHLTASGTRGDTENPIDPRPDPQRRP